MRDDNDTLKQGVQFLGARVSGRANFTVACNSLAVDPEYGTGSMTHFRRHEFGAGP